MKTTNEIIAVGTRALDELGRIVLPAEIRNKLNLKAKDIMGIYISGDTVLLRKNKSVPHCAVCGTADNLTKLTHTAETHYICSGCKNVISELK